MDNRVLVELKFRVTFYFVTIILLTDLLIFTVPRLPIGLHAGWSVANEKIKSLGESKVPILVSQDLLLEVVNDTWLYLYCLMLYDPYR